MTIIPWSEVTASGSSYRRGVSWSSRWRADVVRPEAPVATEERPFLLVAGVLVVVAAQLTAPGTVVELALVAVAGVALALRGFLRHAPAEAFAVVIGVTVAIAVGRDGNLELSFFLGVGLTLYAAWHVGSTTRALAVATAGAASPVVASLVHGDLDWVPWVTAHAFTLTLGRSLYRQRALIVQLEAAREALADHAVAEERRRIARELHDLAGHTLAAMMLHVTGARHVLRRDIDDAERALRDAETVGRLSLDQIRVTVAQLRTSERGTDPAPPGSADLDALVEEYRRAGLSVAAEITPDAAAVDGPAGTALHRICREALANVARHAPGNRVELVVAVDRGAGALQLAVADHGAPARAPSDGAHFGLIGMRERAVALGGSFDAGPTADGWRVEAQVPLGAT